ncbi:MAG: hypothetical protein QM619_16175 [Micropruina sp.]|uniref:hypothetical protein n=1 Tax=Micropruina sp. TaxID=2737536 RepID=UPI0039E4DD19
MSIKTQFSAGRSRRAAGRRHRRSVVTGKPARAADKRAKMIPGRDQKGALAQGESVEFAVVLEGVLATVPAEARKGFVRSIVDESGDALDPTLWGRAPDRVERKEAALANLRAQYEARRRVLEASLTRGEAAELLEVSEQAILDRLRTGDVIGLKKGREWRLPVWQFSPDAERGVLPGLARLGEAFPGGVVSMTNWATRRHPDLGGATPADRLAAGQVEDVIKAARIGTAAAW